MLLLKRMDLAIITLPLATRLAETVFHRHLSARARGKRESEAGVRYVRSRWRQQSKCSPFVTWSLMAATCTTLHSPSVLSFYFFPLFFWVPSLLIRHVDRVAALSSVQAASVILIECKECRQFSFPFGVCVCVCVCVRCVCASDRISLHCFTGPILFSAFLAPRFPSSSRCLPPSSPLPHPDLWGPLAYFVTLIFFIAVPGVCSERMFCLFVGLCLWPCAMQEFSLPSCFSLVFLWVPRSGSCPSLSSLGPMALALPCLLKLLLQLTWLTL